MPSVEVHSFQLSVPALTLPTAPRTFALTTPVRTIDRIEWRVPAGHNGLVGWRLAMAGAQVVPANAGAWIVTDDESGAWELTGLPNSGAWQLVAYNTGTYPHLVWIRLLVSIPAPPPQAGIARLIPASAISLQ